FDSRIARGARLVRSAIAHAGLVPDRARGAIAREHFDADQEPWILALDLALLRAEHAKHVASRLQVGIARLGGANPGEPRLTRARSCGGRFAFLESCECSICHVSVSLVGA